jgi:hypothetical protein
MHCHSTFQCFALNFILSSDSIWKDPEEITHFFSLFLLPGKQVLKLGNDDILDRLPLSSTVPCKALSKNCKTRFIWLIQRKTNVKLSETKHAFYDLYKYILFSVYAKQLLGLHFNNYLAGSFLGKVIHFNPILRSIYKDLGAIACFIPSKKFDSLPVFLIRIWDLKSGLLDLPIWEPGSVIMLSGSLNPFLWKIDRRSRI